MLDRVHVDPRMYAISVYVTHLGVLMMLAVY